MCDYKRKYYQISREKTEPEPGFEPRDTKNLSEFLHKYVILFLTCFRNAYFVQKKLCQLCR